MKKIVCIVLSFFVLVCLCSCTDKNALEREIKQQIDQAKENLDLIDEVQKKQDEVKDILDRLG